MAIKIFRWKFDDGIFEEFENYLSRTGKDIDSLDEDDVYQFLKGFNTTVSDTMKEAFLNTMARRGLSKLISFGVEFDYQCDGCGEMIYSTHGVELELGQESYLVCESCSKIVMKIKESLDMGQTPQEVSKMAEEISEGRTQIIFYEE
jgi:DNA-directed RNA polymerase subunit RPC12/RpoP